MTDYWDQVDPYWNECPTEDPAAYVAFYNGMPTVSRDLLTTHWVVSEVCNGGFHQLFTNPTGVLVPEAITGFCSMGLIELADIASEACSFFGQIYPRERAGRIEALERFAAHSGSPDNWNPFVQLDERFYSTLNLEEEQDRYTEKANIYAELNARNE